MDHDESSEILDPLTKNPGICDAIFEHISHNWSARDIVKLKCVSKAWAQLVSEHIRTSIALSRWEDDTKDWYFPFRFEWTHVVSATSPWQMYPLATFSTREYTGGRRYYILARFELDPSRSAGAEGWNSCIWSGVHHASREVHRLPHLPPRMHLRTQYDEYLLGGPVASAGGVLLFADMVGTSAMFWTPSSSLVVLNPLTRRWRSLPAADNLVPPNEWNAMLTQAHMVVDERAESYKVILTDLTFACVYDSTSNSWRCRRATVPLVPARPIRQLTHRERIILRLFRVVPSVIAAGKLHNGDLEVLPEGHDWLSRYLPPGPVIRLRGFIRIFKFDYEAGTWEPPVRHALRTYFPAEMPDEFYGFGMISLHVKLVGCMDGVCAILPAHLNLTNAVDADIMRADNVPDVDEGQTYESYGCLPVQFYVLRLNNTSLAPGRILVRIPSTLSEREKAFRQRIMRLAVQDQRNELLYRCIARGRVIRLLWDDYLVEYDVVTGGSMTKILPDNSFGRMYRDSPALDYRPSFHMLGT